MRALTQRYLQFFSVALLLATLTLTGCQTAPPTGLTPAQIAVLKQHATSGREAIVILSYENSGDCR